MLSMRNTLAIAQKELRAYFASPIAYIVMGFFALLYGWFFYYTLVYFVRGSMSSEFGAGGPQNINEMMIRPLVQNAVIILLFLTPSITMRTYAEEKRSGTIELLLTSPLTDLQIIMGKFVGAMTLYLALLSVTLIHISLLFVYGNPEWKPIATGYLGLVLLGGSFISVGLLISSLTKNQIIAGIVTFAVLLFFWVISWNAMYSTSTIGALTSYLSIIDHLDDFSKGVIDTTHLVYYLSFISFGLFLTAKSVDSERWRG
jgi:ABC-2 type transport system permease protein